MLLFKELQWCWQYHLQEHYPKIICIYKIPGYIPGYLYSLVLHSSRGVEGQQVSRLVHEVHNIGRGLRRTSIVGGILREQGHLIPSTVVIASIERTVETDAVSQTLEA